ncbi:Holliday junction branch migration protein RuvA [Varunaivibrio sulfuroxidans]|uniref:Holliday junction branch migration complex subunit RuvA n=1 Tax=Varunaivibrio sulfuroxidans TaxID=1773489 RepID=A0A4R3JD76_9PROT|nr:Holliday junction branch migration protein RuvA [Varunaivibrio sulfuroxidans]TCS63146.1 Holliday junction DNA helicase subunit RuvA [Varunaivibrio sulfuroxidans]WES32181.1 Holliday junction branch migration protein RuvA [Varunaivibrio sulfuroxidans]
MIAKLSGTIDQLGDDWTIVDVGGVGYLVFCSGKTLSRLFVGEPARLSIETHVREDHIHLYGFYDAHERDWFKLLTTVQGVGAKVALGILSALSGDELTHAIAAADKAAISRAPGVGPKLAARIASELKDKVAKLTLGMAPSGASQKSPPPLGAGGDDAALRDAVSALVNLGYGASDALGAVAHAASTLEDPPRVEDLIRLGLGELGLKEGL